MEVRGHLEESVLSFYHVGPGHGTEVVSFGGKSLHLLPELDVKMEMSREGISKLKI